MVFLGEYPSLCVRTMHAVRTQCKHLAYQATKKDLLVRSSFFSNFIFPKRPYLPMRVAPDVLLYGAPFGAFYFHFVASCLATILLGKINGRGAR